MSESNSTPNSPRHGEANEKPGLDSEKNLEAPSVTAPEDASLSKEKDESESTMSDEGTVDDKREEEKIKVDKKATEEKELELQPKLSFSGAPNMLDFVPPVPVATRQQFTPPRPNQPVVVQHTDSSNPKSHYQITWNPVPPGYPPHDGFSPLPNINGPVPYSSPPPPDSFFNTN